MEETIENKKNELCPNWCSGLILAITLITFVLFYIDGICVYHPNGLTYVSYIEYLNIVDEGIIRLGFIIFLISFVCDVIDSFLLLINFKWLSGNYIKISRIVKCLTGFLNVLIFCFQLILFFEQLKIIISIVFYLSLICLFIKLASIILTNNNIICYN